MGHDNLKRIYQKKVRLVSLTKLFGLRINTPKVKQKNGIVKSKKKQDKGKLRKGHINPPNCAAAGIIFLQKKRSK